VVYTRTRELTAGDQHLSIPVKGMAAGTYTLSIRTADQTASRKVVIMN
jgi:hypothetical protein